MKLIDFLNNKTLFYDKIDYNQMKRVYKKIKNDLKIPNIIQLVGTNAKGTTGRFMAYALLKSGFSVGHYSSPHILDFNERIWLNGENISYKKLNNAHQILQNLLTKEDSEKLTYFEYTTFIAIIVYADVDYIILEAGLGGEFDATSVFEHILLLVTPIAFDHQDFLGNTIEDIARTKLKANQKKLILGSQKFKEVENMALKMFGSDRVILFYNLIDDFENKQLIKIIKEEEKPKFLLDNLQLAYSALKYLNIKIKPEHFKLCSFFGRMQKIDQNITIDVGHNVLAAQAILAEYKGKEINLIFNTFADKDVFCVLKTLKPIINQVDILKINNQRIIDQKDLKNIMKTLNIRYNVFRSINSNITYLVFGSFAVAEKFIKEYYAK